MRISDVVIHVDDRDELLEAILTWAMRVSGIEEGSPKLTVYNLDGTEGTVREHQHTPREVLSPSHPRPSGIHRVNVPIHDEQGRKVASIDIESNVQGSWDSQAQQTLAIFGPLVAAALDRNLSVSSIKDAQREIIIRIGQFSHAVRRPLGGLQGHMTERARLARTCSTNCYPQQSSWDSRSSLVACAGGSSEQPNDPA